MVRAVYSPRAAQHLNPVPNAAVHKGLLITSGILGKELDSGAYPADKSRQVALVFDYLEAILAEAGADLQDVVKLDLYLGDKSDRDLVNPHWERLWPNPAHRPARQAHQAVLPDGCCLQAVATAMLGSD
ncbi:MAG: RidA family protein [Pseudomonadota bacterium]